MAAGTGAMAWREDVESLLYDGEAIEARVEVEGSELVVTSHRVLAFVAGEESRYRTVDRPNATGVAVETESEPWYAVRALGAGALGALLLAIPVVVDLSAPVPEGAESGSVPGVAGVGEAVSVIETLFAILRTGLVLGGLLAVVAALVLFGLYLRSRERRLVVAVAGDEDVVLPVRDAPDDVVAELDAAIRP